MAWNGHDGFQAGLVLHNYSFPSKRTEWVVAPLYGFGSQRFGGAARIEHHSDRMHSRLFQNITLGLSGRMASTYHDADITSWYRKLSPYITFDLKQNPLVKPWKHAIDLRSVIVWTGYTTSNTNVYDVTSLTGKSVSRAQHLDLVPGNNLALVHLRKGFHPPFAGRAPRLHLQQEEGPIQDACFCRCFHQQAEVILLERLDALALLVGRRT